MSELDETKENNLTFRFWQGAILLAMGWIMTAVVKNLSDGLSFLNILGLGLCLLFLFFLFILQGKINENARKMRDLE